jgi:uncharacterized protein YqjF (DUF2071 family)
MSAPNMNRLATTMARFETSSAGAHARFLATQQQPLFLCEWPRVLFMHYAVDAKFLQPRVPFALERFDGRAIVSLVGFTMQRFRPRCGGRLTEWLFRPAAKNGFFNVRTYVRHCGEPGAYFMTQWLSHPFCLFARLPILRLPWHHARMAYEHAHERGKLRGRVIGSKGNHLTYSATLAAGASFVLSEPGSLAEFTMERYTAFALRGGKPVVFRIWHEPWPQCAIEVTIQDDGLLAQSGDWLQRAHFAGASYSVGCSEVWMGKVQRLNSAA